MYLRATSRKNSDGSVIKYYQLAHNKRHPETRKPVANIIHSFGRADKLDPDQLKRLCHSIARVCGLDVIDSDDENTSRSMGLPGDLAYIDSRSIGPVWVIEALWEKLGIGKILRKACNKSKMTTAYEKALLAMTANRLCDPESKLGVWDRWLKKVYLPSCEGLKLEQMCEAMDMLYAHGPEIEKELFFHVANLLNLTVDLIFYDTTTASFFTDLYDEKDDDIRKYGRCKEGGWGPQVVVALAVTPDGLPVRCWVFPGNTSDVDTIQTVRKDLRGWNMGRALFVADAGMNSGKNRDELAKACGKYLLACRMSSVSEIKKSVLSKRGRYTVVKDNLHAKEVIVGDGERRRRYILCHNPKEARRQKEHRKKIVATLEAEMESHPNKKADAKWAMELLTSKRFKRYLKVTKSNEIRIDRSKIREAAKYDGKWVLQTNDDTIQLKDAANGYRSLMIIERCFRSMKRTQIKMTPMFHWAPRRIEAHIRICVYALLIQRVAENASETTWSNIQNTMRQVQVSEFFSNNHRFFQRNSLAPGVTKMLKKLKISIPNTVLGIEPRR